MMKRGFTLVELLLYVAIVGVVLFSMSFFLMLLMQSRIKNEVIATTDQEAILVLQAMTQRIRNATFISVPTFGNSAPSLTLTMPDSAESPTIFDLSGGKIRIKEGNGPTTNLTSSKVTINNLSFENLSQAGTSGSAKIEFTVTYINNSGRNEYSYSKTYYGSASVR